MASPTAPGRKLALVIGINSYPGNSKLNYCINDARDIREKLESIRFDVIPGIDCNKDRFNRLIDEFVARIAPRDLILFYFAGHGYQFEDNNYLLPSDYSYDRTTDERKYIEENSINAQYTIHKMAARHPHATIFILDCCRTRVKSRSISSQQGLGAIIGPPESLIAFSCGFNQGAIDDSQNGRNGIFTEHLLKYITTPNQDIETILQMAAGDVKAKGFQLPWRASCLTKKIYLAADNYEDNQERPISRQTEDKSKPTSRRLPNIDLSKCVTPNNRGPTPELRRSTTGISLPRNLKSPHDNKDTNARRLTQSTILERKKSPRTTHDDYESDFDSDESDEDVFMITGLDSKRTVRTNGKSFLKPTYKHNPRLNWDTSSQHIAKPQTTIDEGISGIPRRSTVKDDLINEHLLVHIQSLNQVYVITLSCDATIKQLINILWNKIDPSIEHCRKESHVLLLFTHRMHIFMNEVDEMVDQFLKLSSVEPHFYCYALNRLTQYDEMYTYETTEKQIFAADDTWWTPVCFVGDAQLPRPQSVLLSSLYALRLFFNRHSNEEKLEKIAREAQFFSQIRQYLFSPAALALKHAMEGALFRFEKPLIVDSLIKLLVAVCPMNVNRNEVFDCAPLIFCWIIQESKLNTEDYSRTVTLRNAKHSEKPYFDDPATSINVHSQDGPLVLMELSTIRTAAKLHVDIRSLTKYISNRKNYYGITYFKSDDYTIYDPPNHARMITTSRILRFTDDQIKELYGTMAKNYPSFTLITRSALHSDVHDQLVLMQDRTVALVFQRKANDQQLTSRGRSNTNPAAHRFEMFNPLHYTVGQRDFIKATDLYQVDTNGVRDATLPAHILPNLNTETTSTDSGYDSCASVPVQQITVVLLDRSRSMFQKPVVPGSNDARTVIDMSIIMLGIMSDNIVSERYAHAFGLIHFGTSIDILCPITRSRDSFEKTLTVSPQQQEWTSMYDAINRAITLIITYAQNQQSRVADNYKKLIICISDGIDNHSDITLNGLKDRVKKYNVTIDFVSFLRDTLLTEQERQKVQGFKQLCRETHGYNYQNLPLSDIELGATFEQEAALWICEREPTRYGVVEKPVRRMPAQLHDRATHSIPNRFSKDIERLSYYDRVRHEVKDVLDSNVEHVSVFVCRDDIFFWKVILEGPIGTPYEGGHWVLYIQFGPEYPRQPPSIRFVTEIYHVNISGDGKICHHIFDRGWSTQTTMIDVFHDIFELLEKPNFDDAVSTEKAQLKRDDPGEYDRQARQCTRRHASETIQQLQQRFQLEN